MDTSMTDRESTAQKRGELLLSVLFTRLYRACNATRNIPDSRFLELNLTPLWTMPCRPA